MLVINCVEHCWNLNPTSTIKSFYIQVFELAICTSAIRHLVCPLKFSITFVCDFSWILQFFRKRRQCLCKFLRANKVHYGRCWNDEFSHQKEWIKLTVIIDIRNNSKFIGIQYSISKPWNELIQSFYIIKRQVLWNKAVKTSDTMITLKLTYRSR